MEYFLKLFRNHEEYEEYKREHPTPEPKPIYIPPIPMPSHVIKYSATSEISINENKFDANLMVHDFTDGVGIVLFDGEITRIDDGAFYSYDILTSIDLPSNIISIGSSALEGCVSLTSITVNSAIPPRLSFNVFYDTNNCPIYVPNENIDDYKASSYWAEYIDRIQPIDPSYEARWVELNDYCEDYNLYTKKRLQISYDSGATWEDTSTTKSVMKEYHSASCGYAERWVEDGTMCDSYDLYVKEKQQISHDSGTTWEDSGEIRKGELIEAKSAECGYVASIITYYSDYELTETTSTKDAGLHTNAFNVSIYSHTFENGVGTIEFNGIVEKLVVTDGSYGSYGSFGGTRITKIELPSTITTIDSRAFRDCTSLTNLTITATTPPYLDSGSFSSCANIIIYVPAESVNAYKTAANWSTYANKIQAIQE